MEIFGLKITNVKKKNFLKDICNFNDRKIIFTPNPEILLEAKKDKNFKKVLEKADFLLPDWIGLYIAAQILDNKSPHPNPLPKGEGTWVASSLPLGEIEWGLWKEGTWKIVNMKEIIHIFYNLLLLPSYFFNLFFRRKYLYKKYWDRICGSDLTNYLIWYAEKNNIEITIIDLYSPDYVEKINIQKVFKQKIIKIYPKLKLNYFIYKEEEKAEIIKKINISNSKILFSTLGMKKQEESILEIMDKCKNIKLWLWVWSSFDYITWLQKRAPKIFSSIGIEWLYRLFTWPRKLNRLKRLWNAIFVFTWKVIITKNK